MDPLVYTAMAGAARALHQQSALSHNLANVDTAGFWEQLTLSRSVPVVGRAGEAQTRASTVLATSGSLMQPGHLVQTGAELDVAIDGQGWFAVQTATGQAYTRAGDFTIGFDGLLRTPAGYSVLSEDDQPIEIPDGARVSLARDGTLSAIGAGDRPADIQVLGRLKRVNPDPVQLQRGGDGLFRLAAGQPAPMDEEVQLVVGYLEKSNVNAAGAMVALIGNARQYEMQMRMIQDANGNAERANSILAVGG